MIVGTAGHIDHGKTALVGALTGVDTDRLKEEKARGISIDLGFAYLPAPDGSILGFVDVPGHEKFVRTMLAGATGIDFVLLVVAADDGVMPQTREHLAIVDLLGLRRGIVALTKIDVTTAERRDEARQEIHDLLASSTLAGAEILSVSSTTGEGVEALRLKLFAEAAEIGARAVDGLFRFAVDRSFSLPGAGTIVTGMTLSGAVAVGDHVTISPSGRSARVRSIHAQNRSTTRGLAGERCALNLVGEGVTKESVSRGDFVVAPALHAPTNRIDVALRLLATETRPLATWSPVRLHHAAAEIAARVVPLAVDPIPPGAATLAQLALERPIAAAVGDRFVLRDTTAQRTIGGGVFLDLRAPARKRRTPERLALLESLAMEDAEGALAAMLQWPPHLVDLGAFARDHALSEGRVEQIAARLDLIKIRAGATFVLPRPIASQLAETLRARLASFHAEYPEVPGVGVERLRLSLDPRLPSPVFRAFLQGLARGGVVALDGAWARLAGHEVKLTPADERTWRQIRPLLSGVVRFHPPRVRDIATQLALPETEIRRLLKLVGRMGKVYEIAHDHFFPRATAAEMTRIAVAMEAANGPFSAAQFRDRLDNGRKVAIQILEFFDRHGLTLRRGDLRRINHHRVDLFATSEAGEETPSHSDGREASPVGRPDFKSGRGRKPAPGGFDSLSLPPGIKKGV